MWEPANVEEALAVALLTEFGLPGPQPNPVEMSLHEAVALLVPSATEVLTTLREDGYEIIPRGAPVPN